MHASSTEGGDARRASGFRTGRLSVRTVCMEDACTRCARWPSWTFEMLPTLRTPWEEAKARAAMRRMRCYKALPCLLSSCKSAPTAAIPLPRRSVGRVGLGGCCLLVRPAGLALSSPSRWAFHGSLRCTSAAIIALFVPAASSPSQISVRDSRICRPGRPDRLSLRLGSLFVPASSPPVRHSRAPDYCARIAREHRAPRSNICACAGTSEPSRLALRCMIIYYRLIPSHAAVAAALAHCALLPGDVGAALFLSCLPPFFPAPPLRLCLGLHFSLHAFLATTAKHLFRLPSVFPTSPTAPFRTLPRTTAHNLCHPLVSSFTLSLCFTTTRLRRLAPDACGYQNLQTTTLPFTSTRRTGMLRTFHFLVLESHCGSIVASAQPQHAPCGSPLDLICCDCVTNV